MATTQKKVPVKAVTGLTRYTDTIVVPMLDQSLNGLQGHIDIFNKLPIDLTTYAGAITSYKNSLPAALDGGKIAIAQKNKLRATAEDMYGQLARYAQSACNGDLATFLLSGFKAKSHSKAATPPTSESIRKAEPGPNSGQVKLTLVKRPGATSYQAQWAPVPAGGAPANWASMAIYSVRPPTVISGLIPGTTYAFQVRALVKNGFTDWSDSVTLMCV